jgi:thymidylate synthase (FAD)
MNVELIAITKPVGKLSHIHSSEFITFVARVSNPENQMNFMTSENLLHYLMKKSHWSPFEFVDLTFEIETTRDIGRQLIRHRSLNFQEFSQRYASAEKFELERRECRLQDSKNRQASLKNDDQDRADQWEVWQRHVWQQAKSGYEWAIGETIAKEQARAVLPEGLTPTRMYVKGSVRSWFHYCLVRNHPGTQKEHRQLAKAIWDRLIQELTIFASIDIEKLAVLYTDTFESILKTCLTEKKSK